MMNVVCYQVLCICYPVFIFIMLGVFSGYSREFSSNCGLELPFISRPAATDNTERKYKGMNFYYYVMNYAQNVNSDKTRVMLSELMNNPNIPMKSGDGAAICDAVRKEYPDNEELRALGLTLWESFRDKQEADARAESRIKAANMIRTKVFDYADCYHDEGELREQFKRRPELYLLAIIAGGLYEIADAIRGK